MSEKKVEVFRNRREEFWKAICNVVEQGEAGREWDGSPVRVQHGPFGITLDVHAEVAGYSSEVVTRFRAAYINRDGFRFRIYRHDLLSTIGALFGLEDVKTGDDEFDRTFVVQANSTHEVKLLLEDETIRRRLIDLDVYWVEVRDDEGWFGPEFPEEVDELYMAVPGRVTTCEKLAALYGVFADLLNRLCHLGSAYEQDPHIRLD